MGQVKSGLGQNGPNFLAVIVPKWADFVSFLDQNGEVKIIMSLILQLDIAPGKFKMHIMKYISRLIYSIFSGPFWPNGPQILGPGRAGPILRAIFGPKLSHNIMFEIS